jgi:hypothetical protein
MKSQAPLILIVFLVLLFNSCKGSFEEKKVIKVSIDNVKPEDSIKLVDDLISELDNVQKEEFQNLKKGEDCIFDQATQTDEFLKGIKEFEGYAWDVETKTAEIVLNDHWSLTIKRGGCDHFEMSASFICDRILDIEKDKNQIFDNIIWVTSLLKDFDGDDIKRVIEEGEVSITKRDKFNYHANFMDEKLYELYYFDFNNKDRTTFKIGYYYN